MRVNDLNPGGIGTTGNSPTQSAHAIERDHSGRSAARAGASADQVELSPLSRALEASSSARSARVSQLTAQFQAGRYQVDAAKVARAMVGEAMQATAAQS